MRQFINNEEIDIIYGADGIIGFKIGNASYLYRKNLFGDITEIYNSTRSIVDNYRYSAFGECKVELNTNGIADKNPFRYRGYYYDTETGLYYLQTRYYNPKIGRFINQDSIEYADPETINGLNLYAYCGNNPVMRVDPSGTEWWHWVAGVLATIGAILVVAAITVLSAGVGTTILAGTLVGAVIHGAAVGALIGAGVGLVAGGIIGGVVSGWTGEGILTGMGIGLGVGAIVGAIIGGTVGANGWYNAKALEFTNNPGTGRVVLGRSMDGYTNIAKNKHATYFYSKAWESTRAMKGVGNKGMWKINKAFLQQQIKAGSKFYLASNPAIGPDGYFIKEVSYLVKKGILASML